MILRRVHLVGLLVLIVMSSGCIEDLGSGPAPNSDTSPPFETVSPSNLSVAGPVATITVQNRTGEVAGMLSESSLFDQVKRTGQNEIQAAVALNATTRLSNITRLVENEQGVGAYVPLTNGTQFETDDGTINATIYPDTVVIDGDQYRTDERIDADKIIMDRHDGQPWPYYRVWDHTDIETIEQGTITSPASSSGVRWQAQLVLSEQAASRQQQILSKNYEYEDDYLEKAGNDVHLVYRFGDTVINRLQISSTFSRTVIADMAIQGREDTAAEARREFSLIEASVLLTDIPDDTTIDIEGIQSR